VHGVHDMVQSSSDTLPSYPSDNHHLAGVVKWRLGENEKTLHAGCIKAEPKNLPVADPFPGARDGQNLISWRWPLPLPTNPVW